MHTQVIVSGSGLNKVINVSTAATKNHHSQDVSTRPLFLSATALVSVVFGIEGAATTS